MCKTTVLERFRAGQIMDKWQLRITCWKKKWHEPICKKDQDFVLTPIDTYMTVRQGMLTDCMLLTVGNLSLSESLTHNRIRYREILAAQNSWITDRLFESPIRNLPRREPLYCGWWTMLMMKNSKVQTNFFKAHLKLFTFGSAICQ